MKNDLDSFLLRNKRSRNNSFNNISNTDKNYYFKINNNQKENKYQNNFNRSLRCLGYEISKFEQRVLLCHCYFAIDQEFNLPFSWNQKYDHCFILYNIGKEKVVIDFTYNNSNLIIINNFNNGKVIIPNSEFEKINFNDIDDKAVEYFGNKYLKNFLTLITQDDSDSFESEEKEYEENEEESEVY